MSLHLDLLPHSGNPVAIRITWIFQARESRWFKPLFATIASWVGSRSKIVFSLKKWVTFIFTVPIKDALSWLLGSFCILYLPNYLKNNCWPLVPLKIINMGVGHAYGASMSWRKKTHTHMFPLTHNKLSRKKTQQGSGNTSFVPFLEKLMLVKDTMVVVRSFPRKIVLAVGSFSTWTKISQLVIFPIRGEQITHIYIYIIPTATYPRFGGFTDPELSGLWSL